MQQEPIRELQHDLRLLAMMDDQYLSPEVDGVYGKETADAVRAFQRVNGLPVTGEVDTATAQKISEEYAELLQLIADPQPICPFPSPYFVLRNGESGSLVYILQAMLAEICGEFVVPKPPAVTGTYDDATKACVQRWQQVLGLPADGEIDRFCWDRLAELYNMRLL